MMTFQAQETYKAGLYLFALIASNTVFISKTNAHDNMPPSCEPILSDELGSDNASQCIKDIINRLGVKHQDSSPSSSYALGARFQSEVANEFSKMDYAQFLLGALDQANKKVRYPNTELESKLQSELLSTAEQSQRYVKNFAGKPNAVSWKGVYYIDRTEAYASSPQADSESASVNTVSDPTMSTGQSVTQDQDCQTSSSHQYVVEFSRLELDAQLPARNDISYQCVSVDENEVIRGWRTALQQMDEGNTWELVIPAALAYGNQGTGSPDDNAAYVEADEALRFLIRLHGKS